MKTSFHLLIFLGGNQESITELQNEDKDFLMKFLATLYEPWHSLADQIFVKGREALNKTPLILSLQYGNQRKSCSYFIGVVFVAFVI